MSEKNTIRQDISDFIETHRLSPAPDEAAWGEEMAAGQKCDLGEAVEWIDLHRLVEIGREMPDIFSPPGGNFLAVWREEDDPVFLHIMKIGEQVRVRQGFLDKEENQFYLNPTGLILDTTGAEVMISLDRWFVKEKRRLSKKKTLEAIGELWRETGTALALVNAAINTGILPVRHGHLAAFTGGRA
ncbi:MAG: hypothetical protein A2Y38_15540 [Spirochaetes bacterium GWB1_59_5]|nr:MAG: hypothetical protein A2Y38_15540 [Spirochaetes bacterium GWB1_59_5]